MDCLKCHFVRDIWNSSEKNKPTYKIRELDISHTVAATASSRRKVTELLISNISKAKIKQT